MSGRAPLFALTLVFALALGALVAVATWYVARYGPSGDGWSFRGNGAITVYFAIPAVLAAGWTALAAHATGRPWLLLGAGALAVGLALVVLDASLLPLFGPRGDRFWTPIVSLAVLVWMVAAPRYALLPRAGHKPRPIGAHIAAGAVFLVGAAAGLIGGSVILPAGS